MPYLPNGTFAESKEEYLERLEREIRETRAKLRTVNEQLAVLELVNEKLEQENVELAATLQGEYEDQAGASL